MLDDALVVLEDGRWHPLAEIANQTGISEEIVSRIARFLSKYGLAEINDDGKKVKLDPRFLELPT